MRGFLARLVRSQTGAVAPTVALSLVALIGAGGLAFDYAHLASLDTELQDAADHAALAAASQLDGQAGACSRAALAARALVVNETRFANDGQGIDIGVATEAACDAIGTIRFYQDKPKTTAATSDANARFVQVTVETRRSNYAFTPIAGALNSGNLTGTAYAGLGSAVCKVPPLMICNPNPGTAFNADGRVGDGVLVVAKGGGNTWSPGNFGYLDVGATNNGAPDQLQAIAYQDAPLDCSPTSGGDVDPGTTAPAIDAINTRFDIYNFASGSGSTLGQCFNGLCPAALNVTKDLVRPSNANGNNACKIHNQGWQLPSNQFSPRTKKSTDGDLTQIDSDGLIDAMGLPRDNCHYTSYASSCTNGRIGDGKWARGDYFNKYHAGNMPSDASTITRYNTYLWEINNNSMPKPPATVANAGGNLRQQGAPVCSSGTLDPTRDRRVITVAVAENCASLTGSARAVDISEWVDMFLVEPSVGRPSGATSADVYLEIIRKAKTSGNGQNAQLIRRDVPYLIE